MFQNWTFICEFKTVDTLKFDVSMLSLRILGNTEWILSRISYFNIFLVLLQLPQAQKINQMHADMMHDSADIIFIRTCISKITHSSRRLSFSPDTVKSTLFLTMLFTHSLCSQSELTSCFFRFCL